MNLIHSLIKEHGGYISTKDINDRSTYYQLLDEVKKGRIIRIRQGLYALEEDMAKQMIDIEKIVPHGILCLYSAWTYYQLTTQIPLEYYVAVDRGRKIRLPGYPPIKLCYWSKNVYQLGVNEVTLDEFKVRIYDLEKSVCDAIKYRSKIGIDISSEIFKNYLQRKDRNIDKLMKYAKILRVETTLKNYMEIQL